MWVKKKEGKTEELGSKRSKGITDRTDQVKAARNPILWHFGGNRT